MTKSSATINQKARDHLLGLMPLTYRGLDRQLLMRIRQGLRLVVVAGDDMVALASELVAMDPNLSHSSRESLFILAIALLIAEERGETRIDLESGIALEEVLDIVSKNYPEKKDPLRLAVVRKDILAMAGSSDCPLVGVNGVKAPIVLDQRHAYIEQHYFAEQLVADKFKELASQPLAKISVAVLNRHVAEVSSLGEGPRGSRQLSADQVAAVTAAVTYPIAAITGGPGTGKTTIVVSMLRLLMRLKVDPTEIALATFTGRAAFRLRQTILETINALREGVSGIRGYSVPPEDLAVDEMMRRNPPMTLHRLLAANHDSTTFANHRGSQLRTKWVIVDEASMIDIKLASRLMDALPSDAHLVLLGDVDQLPPIGAGRPFKDLLGRAPMATVPGFSVVRLTDNYRMRSGDEAGTNILSVAANIRSGATDKIFAPEAASASAITMLTSAKKLPDSKIHLFDTDDINKVNSYVAAWYKHRYAQAGDHMRLLYLINDEQFDTKSTEHLQAVFAIYNDARIFCFSNQGPHGVSGINQVLHEHQNRTYGLVPGIWALGEPVMATNNDYKVQIYNGDIGIVLRVRRDAEPEQLLVVFETVQGYRAFTPSRFGENLVSAFAITVHKGQGSETKHSLLVLPHHESELHTRATVYTAITRASQSVVLVGPRGMVCPTK